MPRLHFVPIKSEYMGVEALDLNFFSDLHKDYNVYSMLLQLNEIN